MMGSLFGTTKRPRTGLSPHGLTVTLGIHSDPNRRLAKPWSLAQYVDFASENGLSSVELHLPTLLHLEPSDRRLLRDELWRRKMKAIISTGPPLDSLRKAIEMAAELESDTVRVGVTTVLCGDRSEPGTNWPDLVHQVRQVLTIESARAATYGVVLALENHQDFMSAELVDLCATCGENLGITLDTGNLLAVGECPIRFAQTVAPYVRHVHLKDYRAHFSDEGFRLVRCAIGDGCIPIQEMLQIVLKKHGDLIATVELGALEAGHIRLFNADWWRLYPLRSASQLAEVLLAARKQRMDESDDWRTPWERGEDAEAVSAYELREIHRSLENLRRWNWI